MPRPRPPNRAPIPVPTDADRAAAFPPPIAHGAMDTPEINSLLLIDRLEHGTARAATARPGRPPAGSAATSTACGCAPMANAAAAAPSHRRWKPVWPQRVAVVGRAGRRAPGLRPADSRTWAAIGIQGWHRTSSSSATLYMGSGGQVLAKAEVEYDVLLTNRLILQPLLEATVAAKDEPEYGIGRGLNKVEPGCACAMSSAAASRRTSASATNARLATPPTMPVTTRDTRWVAGVRMWF
jgi:copper resistance protein B